MNQINVALGTYVQGAISIPDVEFSLNGVSSELFFTLAATSANFMWVTCFTKHLKQVDGTVVRPTTNTRINLDDGRVLEVLPFPESRGKNECYEYTTPSEERIMIFTRVHTDKTHAEQS